MLIAIKRHYETSRSCRALLGKNLGHFSVTDAGCRIVATRQTKQRRRSTLQPTVGIKHQHFGMDLVHNHERHALVVPGVDNPVSDVRGLRGSALLPKVGALKGTARDASRLMSGGG